MGLFRFKRKKKKKGSQQQWSSPLVDNYVSSDSLNSYQAQADGNETTRTDPTPPQQPETIHPVYNTNECSMEQIPTLLHELAATVHTASDEAARVLRQLFALSEHCTAGGTLEETRQEMVADGTLVPALLLFLQRCRDELKLPSAAVPPQARNSSSSAVLQQPQLYLALLVLNNISIPAANKRLVALEYNGAAVLCSLLCDDPSCHLVAIVLVNLTFGDVSLRRELACADIDLLEALSFAFRVAALTEQEYETRKRLADASGRTPSERLSAIFAFDKQQHQPPVESTYWPPTQDQIYPDTVRWCLCAMQNLTRPGKDAINNFAAFRLIHTGIVPYILRCLKISEATVDTSFASAATNDTPVPSDPADCIGNHPSSWGSQSAQDAALFVVMNLATDPSARKFLLQTDTVTVLAAIARCGAAVDGKRWKADRQLIRLQGVKARMALAYLVGSSGHFGQKCRRMGQSVDDVVCQNENVLLVSKIETEQLMETLANTLHRRSKAGSGGYSAVTFNLKYVLLGIRCLLTQPKNQEMFAETNMELLNALFIKVIALFALRNVTFIDTEAAEYACMSLYHLSHYGFHVRMN